MTNEEIVKEIQSGKEDLYPLLWEQTKRFIASRAKAYHNILNGSRQIEYEDLVQSGYLALVDAVNGYESGEASFLHYLALHLKRHFRMAAGLVTWKRANDPLFKAARLEQPIGEDITLSDTVEDSRDPIENVEERIWVEQLRAALEAALDRLPEEDAGVIRSHYFEGKSLNEIAETSGVSPERIRQRQAHGMRLLRNPSKRRGLEEFIDLKTNFYAGSNFFKTNTSPVEHLAIIREGIRQRQRGEFSD